MKNSGIVLLAGLFIFYIFVSGVYSGFQEGIINKDTIILALKVIGGFVVVCLVLIFGWFGWAYYTFSREEKEKAKGE